MTDLEKRIAEVVSREFPYALHERRGYIAARIVEELKPELLRLDRYDALYRDLGKLEL